MVVEITQDLFVIIWISAAVGALVSHYLPNNVFSITRSKGLNTFLTAIILSFLILLGAILILKVFNFVV
ncbi:MAG: hypothetical protein AABY07_09270 [Nanoarchaeota archaeon]